MTVQYNGFELEKHLKRLSVAYELIIFTSLPRCVIEAFLSQATPDIRPYFTHIISRDDIAECSHGYMLKDCSVFLGDNSRDHNELLVVETNGEYVDTDSLSTVIVEPYLGSERYEHLTHL